MGRYSYPKDENAYSRLLEMLNRARRAGLIPFDAIRDDGATRPITTDAISRMASHTGPAGAVRFERVAVTPEQIERYSLPEAPPKKTDNRGGWQQEGTVQCEALDPADLAREIEQAVRAHVDFDALTGVKEREESERLELLNALDAL